MLETITVTGGVDTHGQTHTAAALDDLGRLASSGRTDRHRLNRGGDREANCALFYVVLNRMRYHQPTKDYVQRRQAQGLSRREIMRCLKRYLVRELLPLITDALAPSIHRPA